MLSGFEHHQQILTLSNKDVEAHEDIQGLLFSIAIYLKTNPSQIKSLIIDSIEIPVPLINTYSVALQVIINLIIGKL